MGYKVQVGLSNKHLHLSKEHVEALLGPVTSLHTRRILCSRGSLLVKKLLIL